MSAELGHGDGGFTDNLGLMPLLARQVRNIIVFVNSSSEYRDNEQLQSYFMPLPIRDGNGDKTMNPVFEQDKYLQVLAGFDASTKARGGAIFCERNWTVEKNELYNIRGYTGLNICWVYNYLARDMARRPARRHQSLAEAARSEEALEAGQGPAALSVLQDVR